MFYYIRTQVKRSIYATPWWCQSYITDLGSEWAPAILESENELAFIQNAQTGKLNIDNYFIGGFTNEEPGTIIGYSRYNIGSGS